MKVDTSSVSGNPEATATQAAKAKRASLAPTQPLQQDRSIATAAAALETQARIEIAKQKYESGTEILNDKFNIETNHTENETNKEAQTETNIEAQTKCAECGGQHSAESHSVAVKLGNAYNQPGVSNFFPYREA